MSRHKCIVCKRMRNAENLVSVEIPSVIRVLFEKRDKFYICKNYTAGHYSNYSEARRVKHCTELFEKQLQLLEQNVSSGMTFLLQENNKLKQKFSYSSRILSN